MTLQKLNELLVAEGALEIEQELTAQEVLDGI